VNNLHQWLNTGLLAVCAAALVGLWLAETRAVSVQCLDQNNELVQRLKPDRPGYCIAIAPQSLDRD